MKKNDRYTSLIWAAFGLYIAFEGYRLEIGTLRAPQAGFLVFWSGIVLSGLSMGLFFQASLSKEEKEKEMLWRGRQWLKGVKLILGLLVYVLVLNWMGFLLSTFLLLLFLLKGLEPQRWRVALPLSILVTALCQIVFGLIFEFRFPEGFLGKIFN